MKKYRRYSIEFKKSIVDSILSESGTTSQLAREHGIHPNVIYKWVRQFQDGKLAGSFTSKDREKQAVEAELNRYKQKVGELLLENDLLKKFLRERAEQNRANGSIVSGRSWEASKKDVT